VHRERAQNWVRNIRAGKPLEYPWVFAGSGFWVDETTGQKSYLAESGDFICVSNFASAMLDLPVESSQANENLVYAAYTERIPPLGTRVRLVLTPKLPK
ncbi:MAG TPA: YdjY domain-containing protein, partial [Pirellulales bacterium]|nr:YdjY domain-containing protein [Pirellulales bacterium]